MIENYELMLRSTWPVVGFQPNSRWDRDQADGRRGRFQTAPYRGA